MNRGWVSAAHLQFIQNGKKGNGPSCKQGIGNHSSITGKILGHHAVIISSCINLNKELGKPLNFFMNKDVWELRSVLNYCVGFHYCCLS